MGMVMMTNRGLDVTGAPDTVVKKEQPGVVAFTPKEGRHNYHQIQCLPPGQQHLKNKYFALQCQHLNLDWTVIWLTTHTHNILAWSVTFLLNRKSKGVKLNPLSTECMRLRRNAFHHSRPADWFVLSESRRQLCFLEWFDANQKDLIRCCKG